MFGQNPIRPLEQHLSGSTLRVQEVFYTLQGEGPFSGVPCTFIRLAGCNLRCHFCDTQFDSGWDNALSIPHIIKAMDFEGGFVARKHELVVLTGGEPLIQNIIPLLQGLFTAGVHHVQIETAGTTWVDGMRDYVESGKVTIVCSPKTPKVHPMIAKYCRNWKYVVKAGEFSVADGLPTFSTQRQGVEQPLFRPFNACDRVGTIWISPCDEHDQHKNVANVVAARDICLEHGYRLSLQTHKIVNVR